MSNRTKEALYCSVVSVSVEPLERRCEECGRWSASPTVIELGLHPACRTKRKMREVADPDQPDMLWRDDRADYSVDIVDDVVCVVDNVKVGGPAVTNDIRRVVADLVAQGYPLGEMPVICCDSEMIWDRVVVVDGAFARFQPLAERDKACALSKATARFRRK